MAENKKTNNHEGEEVINSNIRSLKDLLDQITGRDLGDISKEGDSGLAELWPFPFLALVGQKEMKLGLLLSLVNPAIGGVLLVGPRGTGKTTAVRGLIDLLPSVSASNCYYGCIEEDIEIGGMDAVCPDCAEKFGKGEALSALRKVKLIELPLNAKLDDVVGSIDERSQMHNRMRLRRGILSQADKNILFIDEVNLLSDQVVDVILDAAAQGSYTVKRGPVAATYRSRFILIGTMNPEEGGLRPQIMDRFGLRLAVQGLDIPKDRLEAYTRSQAYIKHPKKVVDLWVNETIKAQNEIESARQTLEQVELPEEVALTAIEMIKHFGIVSLRAELTLLEAAKAYAAIDNRLKVTKEDVFNVAPMILRLRRSEFIKKYIETQDEEDNEINKIINKFLTGK